MHTITQYPLWLRATALVVIVALFSTFIRLSRANEEVAKETISITKELLAPGEIQSFGFSVAGIVESSDSVTVRAQTAGVVKEKLAWEGSVVKTGQVLVVQEVPLLAERMALQDAQNGISVLMQDASVIGRSAEKESSFVQKDAASTSVALTDANINAQVEGATALLATQTYGSVTSLISVLDFIDANESHFEGEDLKMFRETVEKLYGSNRTYLSGSVRYGVSSSDDILGFLDTLTKNNQYPDTATLIDMAELIDAELDATKQVLISGEEDFLDSRVVTQNSELYSAYLTYRGSVIEAQANLRAMIGTARAAVAGGDLGTHGVQTENALRTIGYTTASLMANNAEQLALQTDVVIGAGMNVLAGEAALGMPEAPFPGVIDEVFVKVGEFVAPGTPLMSIVGSGAKELKVSVPQSMRSYLKEGAAFTVSGKTVGYVARFSPTAMGGNMTVVIELSDSDYVPGTTLSGGINCELETSGALVLPRSYVSFDNEGPFIRIESKEVVRVTILHDTGKAFVVQPKRVVTEKIQAAVGVAF